MMNIEKYPARSVWLQLLKRPVLDSSRLEDSVQNILRDVNENGDAALRKYTSLFDKVELSSIQEDPGVIKSSGSKVSKELKNAMALAIKNIEKFHLAQKEKVKVVEPVKGVKCWRRAVPIEKVGLYIPGGSAPLFSTILMLGIPAKIAGCREIILCTPPDKNGNINPAILYAAQLVGIKKIFRVGGAQAIAAMAYGTESIPKVEKIFGPGNQYVTCAKQLVQKSGVAIDMPAGPSEVAILADGSCDPGFVASDLLSQAEHGPDSQVILVSSSMKTIESVLLELASQLRELPRKEIAAKALSNSKAILLKNNNEALELLDRYAPEHLILACKDADRLATRVTNAGSVFVGHYSLESAGDYASGPNHTLPTNGYATAYSGVSLDSFVRKITFQKLTKAGLEKIGPAVEVMAEAEGLIAHRNAVSIRLKKKK